MSELAAPAGPVRGADRIVALDALRGFAVLGILLINIQSYSMVSAVYLNPAANDKLDGAGFWVWVLSYLFGDQKFMTIFSALFGAGIVLMSTRAEATGRNPTWLHYRRQFWLLLIGLTHAYALWAGDILVPYALCGAVVYGFRRLSPRWLIVLGLLTLGVGSGLAVMAGMSMQFWPPEQVAAGAAEWAPPTEVVQEEIAIYRGGWLQQMQKRVPQAFAFETFIFLFWSAWRAGGLMLVGMGLFKLGVLSAERDDAFYRRLAAVGLLIGLPVVAYGIRANVAADFAYEYSMFLGVQFNYWGSLLVSLGYVGLIMLAVRRGWLAGLMARFAAAGRMALSNYIGQTVIATLIFYGHGLGMFEAVMRPGQLAIVVAIWIFQLWLSPWWLARYRFGPLEWLWRSLTYMRRQPMRGA